MRIETKSSFKLWLACWILGEPIQAVLLSGPAGEREIFRRARSIMLPTLFYFLVGWLIAVVELGKPWYMGLLVGSVMGYVILSLDRLILSSLSVFGKIVRWVLTFCLAFALSFIVEPFIFEKEMKAELQRMDQEEQVLLREELLVQFEDKRKEHKEEVDQAKQVEDRLRKDFYEEVDGGGGTGYRGVGEVAKAKEVYLKKAEALRVEKENALRNFDLERDQKLTEQLAKRASIVEAPGLLRKSEAILRVAFSNGKAAALFIAITLILFSIEATVLMTKPKGPAPHEVVIAEDWESRQVGMNLQKQDRVKLYRQEEMLKNLKRQPY